MNRRQLLAGMTVGLSLSIAGCNQSAAGGDGDNDGDPGDDSDGATSPTETPTPSRTPTATKTPTATETPTPTPAEFSFLSVTPETVDVERGEAISISATIENRGGTEGAPTVTVSIGSEQIASETPTLGAGESTSIVTDVDTTDISTGSHEYTFAVADTSISGDLTVSEPAPEPTLVDSAIPEPTQGELGQDGRDFSVEVSNDGDTGDVGAALLYTVTDYDDIWSEEQDLEDRDVVAIDGGQTRSVTLQGGDPEVGESKFTFRLWPHSIEATVANEGRVGGTILVEVVNGASAFDSRKIDLRPGQERSVSFETDFSAADEEPDGIDIVVSAV